MYNRLIPASAALLVLASFAAPAAELQIYVFDRHGPAADIAVELDARAVGETDQSGRLSAELAAGSHTLTLNDDGGELGVFEFESAEGESADASVTLFPGSDPVISLDTYTADAALDTQTRGLLRGQVVSIDSGRPLSGATVEVVETGATATTDKQGGYELELSRGSYTLKIAHPGNYSNRTLENVAVSGNVVNETTIRLTKKLAFNLPPMEEVNVVATYVPDVGSVESITADQRDAYGVTEVLGMDQMLRAGDSNAADALRRVTGLTVQDDKFIVIRGQPERYTQTTMNGSTLPSPDPIRRIVPMDLFPTGTLAKIDIQKSYDAALPGSFGGGLIGLETATVPPNDYTSFSASFGGNTQTTGKTGYDYNGSDTDYLGYDDGLRDLPAGLVEAENSAEVTERARGFSDVWAVREEEIDPDMGLGFGIGRNYEAGEANLGVSFNVNWDQEYQHTEITERDYALNSNDELVVRNDQVEMRTDMDVDLNALMMLSAEWQSHTLRSNTLLLRKSTNRASVTEGTRVVSQDLFIRDYLLEWNERELFAQQFVGEHRFDGFDLDWRALLAESSRYSPDRRDYIYRRQTNGQFVFFEQNRANRRYDENNDDITGFGADVTVPLTYTSDWKFDLVSGIDYHEQDRESQTRRYSFRTLSGADLTAPPDRLLDPANLGDTLAVSDQTQTNDNYLGNAAVDAAYVKADLDWTDTVRIIAGLRRENAEFEVQTFQAGGSRGGQRVEAGFDESDTLPSLSVTWRFHPDMQFRLSAGRSLSRPMLNELSPARYYDPETGEEYLGNPDLKPALIDSLDARWEWYLSERELISFGVFSKDYTDPIEQSFVGVGGSAYLRQITNADEATVTGTEFTARVDLSTALPESWAGEWSDFVYMQFNAAFIDSEVKLGSLGLETSTDRPLQGQADEVYNLQIGYDGDSHDLDLSYNHVGGRLQIAGVQGQPDVYQQPVDLLDLNYSYRVFDGVKLTLKGGNLLDTEVELLQGGEVYRAYKEGRSYGVGLSWTIE